MALYCRKTTTTYVGSNRSSNAEISVIPRLKLVPRASSSSSTSICRALVEHS